MIQQNAFKQKKLCLRVKRVKLHFQFRELIIINGFLPGAQMEVKRGAITHTQHQKELA